MQGGHVHTCCIWPKKVSFAPMSLCVLHAAELRQTPTSARCRLSELSWKKSHDGEHQMHSSMEQEPSMRPLAKTQFFSKNNRSYRSSSGKKINQYKVYPHGGILCSHTELQAQLSVRATDHVSTPSRVCINTSRTHKKVITVVIGGEKMG